MHPPVFLTDAGATEDFLASIGRSLTIAVDTEGASFHRFVDRIYLLQISTRQDSAIIDPLTAGTLAPLGRILENPEIEVVFHDADYDLRLLHQDYGWHVKNIFDTRVAAQLLGINSFGLAALLSQFFSVKLDKKHQRADWSMRPLSQEMLEYAAQDTLYLLELRDRLADELEAKGRWGWASEEFTRLEGTKWRVEDEGAAYLRIKGARDLSRRELAIFRELATWRGEIARELDRATFRVAGNETLLEAAQKAPQSVEELARVKGMPRALVERRGSEIIAAVGRGLSVPEDQLPTFPRAPRWDRDSKFETRAAALRTVRDDVARALDMDPGVLCARERLEAVARKNPQKMEELEEVQELRRWQISALGEAFLRALART
ncbi:MAG: ribonuclease D [Anaerolineae bacterium]|nr:ribonuclease D [Gemmatimonadaceae bacterium]